MRVVLVGAAGERDLLRRGLDGAAEVIGEFLTLAAARAASLDADAFVVASDVAPNSSLSVPLPREAPAEPLTTRELEVLDRLAEGLSNKAIAAQLGISDQTVKFHVATIIAKLGAANRTAAVRLAARRGLITL